MRARALRHLRQNVVGYVALFVALGGSATAATYVVSSNAQIGPGTVSGAKPPTGDHANLIAGSIAASDLSTSSVTSAKIAANAVNSARVADNSLTGADINESTLGSVPSADNATSLQGHTPGDFVQGGGHVYPIHTTVNASGSGTVLDVPGLFTMYGICGDTQQSSGQYSFRTGTGEGFTIYTDNGGSDPTSEFVAANTSAGSSFWDTNPTDRVMFELDGPSGGHQATIVVFSQARFSSLLHQTYCAYSGHAIVTP